MRVSKIIAALTELIRDLVGFIPDARWRGVAACITLAGVLVLLAAVVAVPLVVALVVARSSPPEVIAELLQALAALRSP